MIEKISLLLANESGDFVPIETPNNVQLEMKIDIAIADIFSQICFRNNSIVDQEIKTAEKFFFALNLKKYLGEISNGTPSSQLGSD